MMLKFLQTTFKSIFAIPTKIQLMQDNQKLISDNSQLMAENDGLRRDQQQLIQENYQLSQNLTAALLKIQDLQEQDIPLKLDETFDSNDLASIEQLLQEFNR